MRRRQHCKSRRRTAVISLDFEPLPIPVARRGQLTITVDNRHNARVASSLALATSSVTGAVINYVDSTCGGGGYSISNGSFSTDLRSIGPGASCTFVLDYVFAEEGRVEVRVDGATSSYGTSPTHSPP